MASQDNASCDVLPGTEAPLLKDNENDSSFDSDHSTEDFSFGLNMYLPSKNNVNESHIPFDTQNQENDSVANEFMNVLNDLDDVLDNTLCGSLGAEFKSTEDSQRSDCDLDNTLTEDSSTEDESVSAGGNCNFTENNFSGTESSTLNAMSHSNPFNRRSPTRATVANHSDAPKLVREERKRKSLDGAPWPAEPAPAGLEQCRSHLAPMGLEQCRSHLAPMGLEQCRSDLNGSCVLEVPEQRSGRLRDSMRRIEPVAMPEREASGVNQITLPVMLFLERNANAVRPSSAPVTMGHSPNDTSSASENQGDAVMGRRALRLQPTASLDVTPEHVVSASRLRRSSQQAQRHSRTRERARRDRSVSRSISLASSSNSSTNSSLGHQMQEDEENIRDSPSDNCPEKKTICWPSLSFGLSCLSCTIGIFNISRFSIFSMRFGINFMAQFMILSLVFGIPLFTLQLCLGHTLRKSTIDMWFISPIFRGIGIALWMTQVVLGVYTIVGVSWMFTYLRDSFVTRDDPYNWAVPLFGFNTTTLSESIPMYFNEVVLQRSIPESAAAQSPLSIFTLGAIKFQVAFNLAVVWLIIFVSHCKGIRSSEKAVYVFLLLPLLGMLILCIRFSMSYNDLNGSLFPETIWSDFFTNSKSWVAAAQETFLTWGLLGVAAQTAGADGAKRGAHSVFWGSVIAVVATIFTLYVSSLIGVASLAVLVNQGYRIFPVSYEDQSSAVFMHTSHAGINTPVRYMAQYASMLGITTWQPSNDPAHYSGYQPLELLTDLVPAAVAALGADKFSPFWPVIFYLSMILFGLAQQMVIWRGVISGLVAMDKKMLAEKESTITFFSCILGFLIGLPLTTDAGLNMLHWFDYVTVGVWCQCILWCVLIVALFAVRGRPYSGDRVVLSLFPGCPRQPPSLVASLLSFTWNVLLPVLLLILGVVDFKSGRYRQLYVWYPIPSRYSYWSDWSRQLGGGAQLTLLLMVPFIAIIQIYRYVNSDDPDILVRIQNLYRPIISDSDLTQSDSATILPPHLEPPRSSTPSNENGNSGNTVVAGPPPKYSPPPSYSTATGAAAAQLARIRRSFRRGVARITQSWGDQATTSVPPNEQTSSTDIPQVNLSARLSRGIRSASLRYSNGTSSLLRNMLRRSLQRNVGGNGARSTEQLLTRPDLLADHNIFTVSGNLDNAARSDTSV